MSGKYDLIIKDGLVVGSSSITRQDVGVKDGKVLDVSTDLSEGDATEVIEASGKYVLPGMIDVHVHPVYVDRIADCSLLGAFGGITTIIHKTLYSKISLIYWSIGVTEYWSFGV